MSEVNTKTLKKRIFSASGMTCASCAVSIESMLKSQEGVENATVNYSNQSVYVEYDPETIGEPQMEKAVKDIGYELITDGTEESRKNKLEELETKRFKELKTKLIGAVILTLPVFILSMFFPHALPAQEWILTALSLPVLAWSGSEFFINAFKQTTHLRANMDTLVALGTGMAFIFSLFNTMNPEFFLSRGLEPHVYYESATVIITFILLGRFLEERSRSRASSAIKKLMGLQPKSLTVIRDNEEMKIPVDAVELGDIVVIKPGEKMPVDGTVIQGETHVDESMITGEPLPGRKKQDDKVFTGTINQQGAIRIRAEKVGSQTVLSRIIEMVQQAQASKPPVQKLVDKIAGIFVPVVITLALITFGVWYFAGPEPATTYAFLTMISVLIIACPCALGLATPTALMVGIGKGAQKGVLIRNADSLEMAKDIDAIVFDKTGTITKGRPEVTEMAWKDESSFLKQILKLIEQQSEHPLANAVVNSLEDVKNNGIQVSNFESITGRGVKAKLEGNDFFVGNREMITEQQIHIDQNLEDKANRLADQGNTVVFFADKNSVLAIIGIADQIKENSLEAIKEFQKMGIEVYMLTGDNEKTAAKVASQVGVKHFKAGVLPDEKIDFIKELQRKGMKVAMAGDGINDSGALAQADLGLAMASGSDIAMESAGITLMKSDLNHALSAIKLSSATHKKIRQNLFWAFFYNVIAIPVAAGALFPAFGFLLNPMIAGAAMAMSSVSVVTNSLRLKKIKI
ncbi:MAG: heavy metal translocating P-type ATPase [Bacteroidales bacterium]|nr:heavy metal translocating P-type ATPase [Bacteroidales bacterium]